MGNVVQSLFNGRVGMHTATDLYEPQEYRKTATVRAVKLDHPFDVVTEEGTMHGESGDWLAEGPAGECWPIKASIFEATYEEVS